LVKNYLIRNRDTKEKDFGLMLKITKVFLKER